VRQRLTKSRLIPLWLTILFLSGGQEAVAAPSAACASPNGSVVAALCKDPKLSQLNKEMHELFRKALLVGDKRVLTTEQGSWVAERNRTCGKKQGAEIGPCIAHALNERIAVLRTTLEPTPATRAEPAAASSPAPAPAPTAIPTPTPTPILTATPIQPPAIPAPKQNADCTNAIGMVGRAICNDATLGHWEDRLGKLYQQALNDASFRTVLANDQQRWIGERTGTCGAQPSTKTTDCILQMTKRRIEQLVQFIISRDDTQDRSSRVEKILSGKTSPPPGLDADAIDRASARTDQSEVISADARSCIRKNAGGAGSAGATDENQVATVSAACFPDFSTRMTALDLGTLAKPSFEVLVRQELGSK
jgi:uncharacterized protein